MAKCKPLQACGWLAGSTGLEHGQLVACPDYPDVFTVMFVKKPVVAAMVKSGLFLQH